MHELYNLHTLVGREEVLSPIDTRFDSSVNPTLPLIASSGIGMNSLSLGPIEGLEGGSTRRVGKVSVRIILILLTTTIIIYIYYLFLFILF